MKTQINLISGNIFNSNKQTITNAVNCVGIMGKGLAEQFKTKYPNYFNEYVNECNNNSLNIGKLTVYKLTKKDNHFENDNKQILNFPTKLHWKNNSKISYIEDGLKYLINNYQNMNITSLALPPLGCGLGGLNWNDVYTLMMDYLYNIEIDVDIYKPNNIN